MFAWSLEKGHSYDRWMLGVFIGSGCGIRDLCVQQCHRWIHGVWSESRVSRWITLSSPHYSEPPPHSACAMPNGVRDGYCSFCHHYTRVHPRVEEDYDFFHGQHCDPCCDWIEVDEEQMAIPPIRMESGTSIAPSVTNNHPLVALIEHDNIGAVIASFAITLYGR